MVILHDLVGIRQVLGEKQRYRRVLISELAGQREVDQPFRPLRDLVVFGPGQSRGVEQFPGAGYRDVDEPRIFCAERPWLAVIVSWRLEAGADAHTWPLPALRLVRGRRDYLRLVL